MVTFICLNRRRFSKGWVDCMEAPSFAVRIDYKYHPMPLLESCESKLSIPTSTHGMEEKILNAPHLIPLRPLRPRKKHTSGMSLDEFDASLMEADVISIAVEIAPSVLCAYGSLISNILHLKVCCACIYIDFYLILLYSVYFI